MIIKTMYDINYRELNEMLTDVNVFPGLSGMCDEENLILFAAYVTIYEEGEWGKSGSKEAVEAILKRYFGVEKINHKKSELYRSWDDWDVDYPIDGIGLSTNDWANVTNIRDAGNGTFVVKVDLFSTFGDNWDDSWLEPVSQWKLKKGVKIINIDRDTLFSDEVDQESNNIYRVESCQLTLKPFVFKGKNTWQIIGVNGMGVPKVLFP